MKDYGQSKLPFRWPRPGRNWVFFALLAMLSACADEPASIEVPAPVSLVEHSAQFEREVIEVAENVFVAVGFGLANSVLLEGDEAVIIVDTLESVEAARNVRSAFREITAKPVAAIIYTHNHADHIFGAAAFTESSPEIIAHESTNRQIDRLLNVTRPAIFKRSLRMFGTLLPPGNIVNAGIGQRLLFDPANDTIGLRRPTRVVTDRLTLHLAGIELELEHAPGETDDQLLVWWPARETLLAGDNFYRAFPNLYTIRGSAPRDVSSWIASLDRMRALNPTHLIPGHTRPLSGREQISAALTDYRDGIQYVHDQTVRGLNQGLSPDELAESVRLPPHLAASPFLQELYGTVAWSVRGIYNGYLGWFDGDAVHLDPLPVRDRAERMVDLMGGPAAVQEAASQAVGEGEYQWAAELADLLTRAEPSNDTFKKLKADALRTIASQSDNPNLRHWALTQALELRGELVVGEPDPSGLPVDVARTLPIEGMLRALPTRLDPVASASMDRIVVFSFPDLNEDYWIHVRRGVAEFQAGAAKRADITIHVRSDILKEILLGHRGVVGNYLSGDLRIEGSKLELIEFLQLFQ